MKNGKILSKKIFDSILFFCYYLTVCIEDADMKDELGTVEYASLLYDFYGVLLSDSQREVMALYHEDNLSLSEIAEELGQSRQAVHYTLRKAEKALDEYEEKLGLIASYDEDRALAEEAGALIEKMDGSRDEKARLAEIVKALAE